LLIGNPFGRGFHFTFGAPIGQSENTPRNNLLLKAWAISTVLTGIASGNIPFPARNLLHLFIGHS